MIKLLFRALCCWLAVGSAAATTYADALGASVTFYEAQMSGPLPSNNRVPWRGSSFVNDKEPVGGKCMSGGFFDAGDNVKFMLPFGWTTTVLAWGIHEFGDGYRAAGAYDRAMDVLRWAADFAAQAHVSDDAVVGGVGDGDADHARWTRPEDVTEPSAVYVLGPTAPGSDVAGSLASALAAASLAFAREDTRYATRLLRASAKLYDFGVRHPGKYSDSLPSSAKFYKSSSYHDEMALAAAFLWKSSRLDRYLQASRAHLADYVRENGGAPWNNFDWDSAYWGAIMLLSEADAGLDANVTSFVRSWTSGSNGITYTPRGLAWSFEWGSLRHNANAQFFALVAASAGKFASGSEADSVRCWAKSQADYILGLTDASPRSFVVGVGRDPPCRPHHRAASCRAGSCDWKDFESPDCNPNTIAGALVGGPGKDDSYEDKRSDYVKNEVAIDYNAGWQGALAALSSGGVACPASPPN